MPHSPVITITYNSGDWHTKLTNAIKGKNYVRVLLKGPTASQTRSKVQAFTVVPVPCPPAAPVPIPYPNIAIGTALIHLPALLTLFLLALTTYGYSKLNASYQANSSGLHDDELIFDLR